jgi:hypothetical protein
MIMIRKKTWLWIIILIQLWWIVLWIWIINIRNSIKDLNIDNKISENNKLIWYWWNSVINFIDENYAPTIEKDNIEDDFTIAGEDEDKDYKDRDFCSITESTDRVLANNYLIWHCYWDEIKIDDLPLYWEFIRCDWYKVYMIVKDNNWVNINNLYIALNGDWEMYRLENNYIYESCLKIVYDL